MTTTCEQLITLAYRKLRELGPTESLLAEQVDRGLEALQGLYDDILPLLGSLTDVYTSDATYTAKENERIVAPVQTGVTITLPTTIEDCATGETRPPKDASLVEEVFNDTGAHKVYVWDAAGGAWVRIDTLALTDNAPLAARYSNALSAMLAVRVAEIVGIDPPALVVSAAAKGRLALASRYETARDPVQVDYL